MTIPNWADMTLYHYLGIGGGVLVVLALLLYFTPVSRLKVPGILAGIIGGLALGTALGVMGMSYYGYRFLEKEGAASEENATSGGGRADPRMAQKGGGGPKGGGGQKGGGQKGGGGAQKGGGARGPNSKAQLVSLIVKLDLLTHTPPAVTLSAEQKKKVRDLIQKLDEETELREDDAKAKLEEMGKILNDEQRKTVESAGYRWPGPRPMAPPTPTSNTPSGAQPNPNPFSEGENYEHLKSLRAQLADKAG